MTTANISIDPASVGHAGPPRPRMRALTSGSRIRSARVGERQVGQLPVRRSVHERVVAVEPAEDPDRSGRHLRVQLGTGPFTSTGEVEHLPPGRTGRRRAAPS